MSNTKLLVKRKEWDSLIKEWDFDKNSLPAEVRGSTGKAWWICSKGHSYEADIGNRLSGKGCARCHGLTVVYEDSIAFNYPELTELFSPRNGKTKTAANSSIYSVKYWKWVGNCGHEWAAQIQSVLQNGCPFCSNRRFKFGFNSIFQTHPELKEEWDPENKADPKVIFWKSQKSFKWICNECGCRFSSKMIRRANKETSCPACAGNRAIIGKTDLTTFAPELLTEFDYVLNELPPEAYMKTNQVYWKCISNHSYRASAHTRKKGYGFCSICRPYIGSSQPERELASAIEEFGVKIIRNSRKIIKPYELDIFVPARKLAIEFNGTYWHNDANAQLRGFKTAKDYHDMKIDRCAKLGINLIFINEEEWRADKLSILSKAKIFAAGWSEV